MDYQVDVEVRGLPTYAWAIWVIGGALSAIVGIWLVLSPKAAIGTLAILLAVGLILNGLVDLAGASGYAQPAIGYLIGAVFLIGGIVVLVRPGKSLWFLAIVVGISIVATGVGEILLALTGREEIEHWMLLAALGVVGVIAGILAIAWPAITVWVLALLIGIRLILFGVLQIAIGMQLRSLSS